MPEKIKTGRPTDYNDELADEIVDAIATSNKGLITLCKENKHWPCRQVILRWRWKHEEFRYKYEEAKKQQVELLVDECIDIADNIYKDDIISEAGNVVCNAEYINRSRLRIDTRKWLASKLAPRIYGDKTHIDATIRPEDALKELE